MPGTEVITIAQQSMWLFLKISGPLMLTALLVGLLVSLFQALTQIQEATLSFVPKVVAIFACLALSMPFIGEQMGFFTTQLFSRIYQVP